ncbi:hypothetical protein ACWEOZ_15510 [Actinoplanes sp. NPDC004185]
MTAVKARTEKVEGLVLVAILLLIAVAAGAASFTHVHDWTMDNTPTGTPGWFGWANAVISELVPVAALLTIRRRRRSNGPIGYPLALLIAAAGLSLAAQLAVAKPGPSGWLLSAVPALAFMALVKLVLAPTHAPTPPAVTTDTAATVTDETPAAPAPVVIDAAPLPEPPAHLVSVARFSVVQHEQTTGQPITVDELAARMSVTPAIAGQLLATVKPSHHSPINGNTPVLGGAR